MGRGEAAMSNMTLSKYVGWRSRRVERDRTRFNEAVRLLTAATAAALPPMEQIAREAGYATTASMDRSFRRWIGTSGYRNWLNQRAVARG